MRSFSSLSRWGMCCLFALAQAAPGICAPKKPSGVTVRFEEHKSGKSAVFHRDGRRIGTFGWEPMPGKQNSYRFRGDLKKLPTGLVREYYPDGELKTEWIFCRTGETGRHASKSWRASKIKRSFYKSGKLKIKQTVVHCVVTGVMRRYYESGKLEGEMPYSHGVRDGVGRKYYESGKLKAEVSYSNGAREGASRNYHKNGKVEFESEFKDDKEHGEHREYDASGKVRQVGHHKNGRLHGLLKTYYESGQPHVVSPYVEGNLEGTGKVYNETGKLKKETIFRAGQKLRETEFHEDGRRIKAIRTYKDDELVREDKF